MADRSGIGAQLGLAEEVTYGTNVVPARFLEFVSEGIKNDIARDESKGLRSGQRVLRSDHWKAGRSQAAGPIQMEVANKGYGVWFKHLLGTNAVTADGLGWKQSNTLGDLWNKSLSLQLGEPDISGVVQPFTYSGCKLTQGTLSNSPDNFLELAVTVDGQAESTVTALGAASAPSETEIFHWAGGTFTIGGTTTPLYGFDLTIANGFKTDRFLMNNTTTKLQPIENALRTVTGTLSTEFDGLPNYTRYLSGTTAQIIATWVCVATYDTAKPFKIVVTLPACRFDGETPDVTGEDVTMLNLPFKALDAGAGAITLDYYSSDVAA